jgi:hypothetical protein
MNASLQKTYGAWKVTEREYQIARRISRNGTGVLSEGAFQVVRYVEGQPFYRDHVEAFLRALRFNQGAAQ